MQSTLDVVRALARANPAANLSEDRVRRVLRKGLIQPSCRVGGRFVWSSEDVAALARHLNLQVPDVPVTCGSTSK